MVSDRKESLDLVKEKVEAIVSKINGVETINKIGDEIGISNEYKPVDRKESVRTPFYKYLIEMKPRVEELAPTMKYLEIVAFV